MMKRTLFLGLLLLFFCFFLNACTLKLTSYHSPFEQNETEWIAEELDMSFCVTYDDKIGTNRAYGSLNINGITQDFFVLVGHTEILFEPIEIRYDDVIRDDDYILKCTANRLKSDNEYCLTIVDSSIDFGNIETLTFIREDSE